MANYSDIKDRVYLVTGSTSGIGKSITISLAEQGAKLVLLGRNEKKIKSLIDEFSLDAEICVCDLTDIEKIEQSLINLNTRLDGVVLCAGIAGFWPIKFLKYSNALELFNVNFFSNVSIIQTLLKRKLIKNGASIVLISSISQYVAEIGTSIYSASKAALSAYARNAALELSSQKIRVNTISPGLVKTDLLMDENGLINNEVLKKHEDSYPLGLGEVTNVSEAVLFLLSESSSWMTGSDLKMDGGFCLK